MRTHEEQRTSLFDTAPAAALVKRHEELKYPYRCEFGEATLLIEAACSARR